MSGVKHRAVTRTTKSMHDLHLDRMLNKPDNFIKGFPNFGKTIMGHSMQPAGSAFSALP
jgi:hypothetical protein